MRMKLWYAVIALGIIILVPWVGIGVLHLNFLFAVIIPYAALAIFLGGTVFRVLNWAKAPVPFHIPTVCGQQKSLPWLRSGGVESPHNTLGVVKRMALEVLVFRSLFRNDRAELKDSGKLVYSGNKYLWLGGLAFHWSLLIILLRHTRFAIEPIPGAVLFLQNVDGAFELAVPTLYITDFLILAGLSFLLLRRVSSPQLRFISLPSDYFAVMLILGIAVSGVLTRLIFKIDLTEVKELARGLLTFNPVLPVSLGLSFYIHLFLVSSLLAYFPFSKLAHAPGIFLSPTRNQANDSRMRRHVNPWSYPVKLHTYAEYEDEFREAMKGAGLPVEKE